ncbi:MAG: class IV adenylate cyclase [Candidatus Micrarchaeaceae archaeon]|jgi:Adenylate cyclase, class 2 (thermophilic)
MKNIELKIYLNSFTQLIQELNKINAKHIQHLHQVDTYYNSMFGRLKLREINNSAYELIFYLRPDELTRKISNYYIFDLKKESIKTLKYRFAKTFGKLVIVEKNRDLWLYKNTRIHLDQVKTLGTFLELETVVGNKSIKYSIQEFNEIVKKLNLSKYKKEKKSYSDLLSANKKPKANNSGTMETELKVIKNILNCSVKNG